jgi:signal transduction histidine kinase
MGSTKCSIEELKTLQPLLDVPDDQLQWLLDAGELREIAKSDVLIEVGEEIVSTSFLLNGRCILYFHQGNQLNEIRTVERGHIMGYLPFSRVVSSIIRVVCIVPGCLLLVPAGKILEATKLYYELTAALVHFMISRIRFATAQQQQEEKMFALGKLSAGLAHELNNPAAAITSNASTLTGLFGNILELFDQSASMALNRVQITIVRGILASVLGREQNTPLSMIQASENESEIQCWLVARGADDFLMAETLAAAGFTITDLEIIVRGLSSRQVSKLFSWLNYHLMADRIAKEIEQASRRISALVGTVKNFSHMDKGSDKERIDVHIGIENTLTLLEYKIRKVDIKVVRRYAADLPHISAFPGQLNQVWVHIFDNAIDAMSDNGGGTLTITTGKDRNSVIVTTQDDGPGIPTDVLPRIFDPFFTTKKIGQGAGLGLEVVSGIIRQHEGSIKVDSAPGHTRFLISLPIDNKE